MQLTHLKQLVNAASILTNTQQVIVFGPAGIYPALAPTQRSTHLEISFEAQDLVTLAVLDNENPQSSVAILSEALGPDSQFYARYGYGAHAIQPWDVLLPPRWDARIHLLNMSLLSGNRGFGLAPEDVVLANLATTPDPLLNMELLLRGHLNVPLMLEHLAQWALPPDQKLQIQSAIVAMHRAVALPGLAAPSPTPWPLALGGADNVVSMVTRLRPKPAPKHKAVTSL